MLNKFFRGIARSVIVPVSRTLVAAGVSPNFLTVLGLLVTLAACYLIAGGRLIQGGVVLAIGGLFDMIDGAVAKEGGMASTRGAFLDSTVDRISDAFLFLAIFWQYRDRSAVPSVGVGAGDRPAGIFPPGSGELEVVWGALLALAALFLGFLVSYIKARAEGLGLRCDVGLAERPERIALPVAGLLFDQLVPALSVLVVLSAITAIQRFVYVWRQAAHASESR